MVLISKHEMHTLRIKYINSIPDRAVDSVRQGGANAPLNFGPEVQYFDEFLKKAGLYALFLYCHSE